VRNSSFLENHFVTHFCTIALGQLCSSGSCQFSHSRL
jgi:hypothetical protein